jgi:hypothetical protein
MIELLRSELPKYYIGSKSNCTIVEGNIYNSKKKIYLGSSKDKTLKKLINESVQYKIHVLGIFDTYEKALNAEKQAHILNDVVASPSFFNLSIATENTFANPRYGTFKNIETGKIARLELIHPAVISGLWVGVSKGTKLTEETKKKIRKPGNQNHFFGKKHTDETKNTIGQKNTINWQNISQEQKDLTAKRTSKIFKGVPKSESHRKKIGKKDMIMLKNVETGETIRIKKIDKKYYADELWVNPTVYSKLTNTLKKDSCIHCGLIAGVTNIKRWHGDNCKFKDTGIYSESHKIRKTERKRLTCIVDGIEYISIREASRQTGIPRKKIKEMIEHD